MTKPAWIPFTAAAQAQRGQRMRASEGTWPMVVARREMLYGQPTIVFLSGRELPVAVAKRQRWQIEV